jgi:hypothetical protein
VLDRACCAGLSSRFAPCIVITPAVSLWDYRGADGRGANEQPTRTSEGEDIVESRTFEGVSADTWERMQDTGRSEHGTVFEPTQDNCGMATTRTPVGTIVLGFEFDPSAERITYTIVRKPFMAASSLIWGGIAATLERCRRA